MTKELTHDEKVALLREFYDEQFEIAWHAILDAGNESLNPKFIAIREANIEKYQLLKVELEDMRNAVYDVHSARDESVLCNRRFILQDHENIQKATDHLIRLVDEYVVSWMWPQFTAMQATETVELPDLGE